MSDAFPGTGDTSFSVLERVPEGDIPSISEYRNQLQVAAQYVLDKVGGGQVATVLGSGLGGFTDKLKNVQELPYGEIPYLPTPTVKGHSGKIVMGDVTTADGSKSVRVMCFAGRLHPYEGLALHLVTFCARLSYLCGCHTILLTNSSGGAIPNMRPESAVLLQDHIRDAEFRVLDHTAYDSFWGVPHMRGDRHYDPTLIDHIEKIAREVDFPLYRGQYWWVSGPVYETKTQVMHLSQSGGSAVGMSTVPSIVASSNLGLRVAGIALCTNVAAGISDEELNHEVVVANARSAAVEFSAFVERVIVTMADLEFTHPPTGTVEQLTNARRDIPLSTPVHFRPELFTPRDIAFDAKELSKYLATHLSSWSSSPSPIPLCFVNSPLSFDVSCMKHVVTFPLSQFASFSCVSESIACVSASLNAGFVNERLVVVVNDLPLDGLSFYEYNSVLNMLTALVGGVAGVFCVYSIFSVFGTETIYTENEEMKEDSKFCVVNDVFDCHGGIPLFPVGLPVAESQMTWNVPFSSDVNLILEGATEKSYSWWRGPNLPSKSEVAIASAANCDLVGISNPLGSVLCRQLGCQNAFDVGYMVNNDEFDLITSPRMSVERIDVTRPLLEMMDRYQAQAGQETLPTISLDLERVTNALEVNSTISAQPVYHQSLELERELQDIQEGCRWLLAKIPQIQDACAVIVSSFPQTDLEGHIEAQFLLCGIPSWASHHCGGFPLTHEHQCGVTDAERHDPYGWTLFVVADENDMYILIAPSKPIPSYYPNPWNFTLILRSLRRCGLNSVMFLANVESTTDELSSGNVVIVENHVDCTKWNVLYGPNDEGMGPRFTPMTDVYEHEKLKKQCRDVLERDIPAVVVAHTPPYGVLSSVTKDYMGERGYKGMCTGLISEVYSSIHCGLKMGVIGIVDWDGDSETLAVPMSTMRNILKSCQRN